MVCLLKEKYKTELQQYKNLLGSEEAAYYVLAMNNGFTLDFTHQGEQSQLYAALLQKNNGDEKKAILEKCIAFTPEFIKTNGNFVEGTYSKNLDKKGEPSIQDLNGGKLCDSSSIEQILQDGGKIVKTLDILEKNNILIRDFSISEAIDLNRSAYVKDALAQFLEEHPDADPLTVAREKSKLEVKWDQEKMDKLLTVQQQKLAEYFDLELVKDKDGNFYYKTKDTSTKAKLRMYFVNSLRKGEWKDENGQYHKGMFIDNDGTNAAINLLYVSLNDGDASTVIHELAHHYIRTFWDSEVVQNALNQFDDQDLIRRYKKSSVPLEEKLVKHITNKILQEDSKSWVYKFWPKFNKMIKDTLGLDLLNYNQRQNILDQITTAFSINEDLQYNNAKQIMYDKYDRVLFSSNYDESEIRQDTYTHLLKMLKLQKKSMKSKILKDNFKISEIEFKIENIKKIDPQDKDALLDAIVDIASEARAALTKISQEIAAFDLNEDLLFRADPKYLFDIKTDIIEYYARIFNDQIISSYYEYLPEIKNNNDVKDFLNDVRRDVEGTVGMYNRILNKYVYNKIDEYADLYVDVGDKEIWKYNAKLWLKSQINNGSLMYFENWLGIASQSASPIIRLVEFLTSTINHEVFVESLRVSNELKTLYDKARPAGDTFSLKNFMKTFCELDKNGQPTGYWLRKKNYGEMFSQKDILMQQLLDEFKDRVQLDDDGEYIFQDNQTRIEFLNKKDDLEDTIINKRYRKEYYQEKRKFLSKDTQNAVEYLQKQIDILIQKCTNTKTGIPEIHKLTQEERQQLDSLYKQKEELASPYEVTYDQQGRIFSIKEKEGIDLQIAEELQNWRIHISKKVKYKPNVDKFNTDRKKLVEKYGESSSAVQWFDWYYSSSQIVPRFYELKDKLRGGVELPDDIKKLYRRKSAILNFVRDKHGFYQPHLERLNGQAWKELQRIENEINKWFALQGEKNKIESEPISENKLVCRYVNGKLTNQPYLFYLQALYPSEEEFMNKFYANTYDENGEVSGIKPMSVFYMEIPFETLQDEKGEFKSVEVLPTGPYQELDPESYYANPDYDVTDPSYMQPKDKFKNPQWEDVYGTNPDGSYKYPARVKFFEALLKTMQAANSKIPNYIDTRSFRMPGMTERTSHLIFRQKGNIFKNLWKHFANKLWNVSDRDVDYNEEVARKPNGDVVYTIPLRWINKLEDPSSTSMDILGSVSAYYEMALNYEAKQKFAPMAELIASTIQGGIARTGNSMKSNGQVQRLKKYMEMYVYGRLRSGLQSSPESKMTTGQKRLAVTLDTIARKSHLKMMSRNLRGILKNFVDAGMTTIVEASAGKYFTKKDLAFSTNICRKEFFNQLESIGTPQNKSKVAAAMQYNGVSGRIYEMFSRQNENRLRRIVSRNLAMGEYTFVDYSVKGWVAPAIYHNHRLLNNFDNRLVELRPGDQRYLTEKQAKVLGVTDKWERSTTYKKEFMNEQQAIYNYMKHGYTKQEGQKAWSQQNITLWDAYDLDSKGNWVLKSRFADIVRPIDPITGKQNLKLEVRIRGTMRERFAVIAGTLPEENRSAFMQTYLGTFIFMLRGWLITFAWDCFRTGSDYSTYVLKSSLNPDDVSDQAIKTKDDLELFGEMFEFESGQSGKGWLMNQPKLWYRLFANGIKKLLNWVSKSNYQLKPFTKTNRQQISKFTFYLAMILITTLSTHLFGRLLEDDPKNILYNLGYSTSVALIPERSTQLLPVAVLDLIKNATAAQSYIDDVNNVLTVPIDFAVTSYYVYNKITGDAEFEADQDKVIKTGSYKGLTKEQRNLLKASSIVLPELGLNNLYKNLSPWGQQAYANWQMQQAPVNIMSNMGIVYKPDKQKMKQQMSTSGKLKPAKLSSK